MSYAVEVEERVKKTLKTLDKPTVRFINDKIEKLSHDPYDTRLSKPVTMSPGRRSARVGDWRIIYYVSEENRKMFVAAVCPRDKAYDEAAKRSSPKA